jgi:AcrR family transcriptional regulator
MPRKAKRQRSPSSRFSPRKQPRQERSVATVEAIITAATYILQRRGWSQFTTNAVAERAGVNIASLYQYFPNKQAIISELKRRHSADVERAVSAAVAPGTRPAGPGELLRRMIAATVSAHSVDSDLDRILEEELPRSIRRKGDGALGERARNPAWLADASALFERHPRPELAAFVARTCVHAVVHEAAFTQPALLQDGVLIDELTALLARYLDLFG